MKELNSIFQKIIENRQSKKTEYQEKFDEIKRYSDFYNELKRWVNDNKGKLITFDADLSDRIIELSSFIDTQLTRIGSLNGSVNDQTGVIQQCMSRIERPWISFSAIGAKRMGKGHLLSTMLNLDPANNDIFLAKSGKPCTATVITLHQGAKRTPVFNKDGQFKEWQTQDSNKAFVYFYSYGEIETLINDYLKKIKMDDVSFSLDSYTKEDFVDKCTKLSLIVERHTTNSAAVEFKGLLLDYLIHAKEYVKYLKNIEDQQPMPIIVDDVKPDGENAKIRYTNATLRKFISYYHHGDDQRHFEVLAVKKVDIYTNYSLGGLTNGSFVISDTAGIGEAKLKLRETLKDLIRNHIDISIAVTKVPEDTTNEDISIPADVVSFHNVISEDKCYVCFPLQFYYVINVPKTARDKYKNEDLEGFKKELVSHLIDRGLPLPKVGAKKDWSKEDWTEEEVNEWNNTHIKMMDVDNYDEVNNYISESVLPNVAKDIAIIDSQLLNSIDTELKTIKDQHVERINDLCKPIFDRAIQNDYDEYEQKKQDIKREILEPLKTQLSALSRYFASLEDFENHNMSVKIDNDQIKVIDDSLEKLKQFMESIKEFYCEPFVLQTIRSFDKSFSISDSDREKCKTEKEQLMGGNNESDIYSKWEKTWTIGKEQKEKIISIIKEDILCNIHNTTGTDEITKLAQYRLNLLAVLEEISNDIVTNYAGRSYDLVIDMIWNTIYKYGCFDKIINLSEKDVKNGSIKRLFENDYESVYKVLEEIDTIGLSVSEDVLKKEMRHLLAMAKVQELVFDVEEVADDDLEDNYVKTVCAKLAFAIWNHLTSIEGDYKMNVSDRFSSIKILDEYKVTFSNKLSRTSNRLIWQGFDDPAAKSSQDELMRFYMLRYFDFFPDSSIAIKQNARISAEKLKKMLNDCGLRNEDKQ